MIMKLAQIPSPPLLRQFSEFLSQQMGLHFPPERWSDLMRGIGAAAREFDFDDNIRCMQWLLAKPLNQQQIEILASHLTIGETYFFRETPVFDALQTHILPPLIQLRRRSGKRLKMWCAACSTGEEAYSLAILVQKLIPDYSQWNISILGTDINPRALRKAVSGIYGDWSFRNAQPWLRDDYFQPLGAGTYLLAPPIKNMVTFSYHNLAQAACPSLEPSAIDIIFCRNVLMYFEPEQAAKVVRQQCRSLSDGGWLIVNPAESSPAKVAQMEAVHFEGTLIYRKKTVYQIGTTATESSSQAKAKDTGSIRGASEPSRARQQPIHKTAVPMTAPPPASYRQALTFYRQGRYPEAAELTAQLIRDQNTGAQAINLLIRIHANQGELATALQWCKQAIEADRTNPGGHYLMAAILLEQGQPEEAMQALKRTLYLDQNCVLAHFTLGNLYFNQGRYREARLYFANTLSLLKNKSPEDVLPESEGITTGRLIEIVQSITDREMT